MRPDAVEADRRRSVREAAREWAKASAIDGATLTQIEALYADDRVRLRWGLAVLAGIATFVGGGAVILATTFTLTPSRFGASALLALFTAASAALTEIQTGRLRRTRAGSELATGWLTVACFFAAWGLAFENADGWLFGITGMVAAICAYRWGFASLAGLAAVLALVGLAYLPWGARAAWIIACATAILLTTSRPRVERLPPAYRQCLWLVFVVACFGLYVAVHYDLVQLGMLEMIGEGRHAWQPGLPLVAAAALTAIVPIVFLVFGIRRHDRLAIVIGAVLIGVSLSTWRYHHPWIPLWLFLTAGGLACFVTAILIRRFLDRSPGRAWRGFTADPLFDDPARTGVVRVATVVGTLGHAPQGDRPFQAGGGESGGGGAQGQF